MDDGRVDARAAAGRRDARGGLVRGAVVRGGAPVRGGVVRGVTVGIDAARSATGGVPAERAPGAAGRRADGMCSIVPRHVANLGYPVPLRRVRARRTADHAARPHLCRSRSVWSMPSSCTWPHVSEPRTRRGPAT